MRLIGEQLTMPTVSGKKKTQTALLMDGGAYDSS
jgi:hypothetical protein